VQVSWIRDGNRTTIQHTENRKRQVLTIDVVKTKDAGEYVCQVDGSQVIKRTMELKVLGEQRDYALQSGGYSL